MLNGFTDVADLTSPDDAFRDYSIYITSSSMWKTVFLRLSLCPGRFLFQSLDKNIISAAALCFRVKARF